MGADYSMRIWLKPDVMAQYGLMPTDVAAALAEQNIEAAPGQFGESGDQSFQYIMRYKGRLQTEEEFGDMVVRATSDGEVLRLKDIANIELGRLTYGFSNHVNGHAGVTSLIFQTAGSNATADHRMKSQSYLERDRGRRCLRVMDYAVLLDGRQRIPVTLRSTK